MMNFSGHSVVITGAGGELGRALCVRFTRDLGAHCFAVDMDADGLLQTERDVRREGGTLTTICGDVRDKSAMQDIANQACVANKRLVIWVNNAGVSSLGGFAETAKDVFDLALDVNLIATINNTRIALENMSMHGSGWIINVASVAGHVAAPYFSAYATSKHGVVGFTRALQLELDLMQSPVQTMLVSPGFFKSKMLSSHSSRAFPEWLHWLLSKPDDVADEILVALRKKQHEVIPSMNGKLTVAMHRIFPRATRKSSRMLLKESFFGSVKLP